MDKILFTLCIVFAGLITGYALQKTPQFRYGGENNNKARKVLQKFVILFMNPVAFAGSIWILDLKNFHLMVMPVAGLISLFSGALIVLLLAKFLGMDKKETGAFFCCGLFTNIGNLGALVCYSFLGEKGFALVPFYKLFEELTYYAAGFPIAKSFSRKEKPEKSGSNVSGSNSENRKVKIDPIVFAVLASTVAGFLLNVSGLKRPDFFSFLNGMIIPLSSFFMLLTIGMAMRFGKMKEYIGKALLILPVKYFAVPLITVGFALAAGLGNVHGGLPVKVVLILSSMPVGVLGLVPPALYGLDLDFANTCWFVSTLFMVATVPLLKILTVWIFPA